MRSNMRAQNKNNNIFAAAAFEFLLSNYFVIYI